MGSVPTAETSFPYSEIVSEEPVTYVTGDAPSFGCDTYE